ncbi:MAG: MFS transporter [Sphingomonas sp.]
MQKSSATTLMAFAAVTTLFFAWGFITSLIDPLVAAVKGIFTLSDVQAQAAAFAFFIAYGLASFPAAVLLARARSIPTILIALGMMIAGCLVMLVAANLAVFALVLLGLFVLASGITILQVAANPLAAALGDPRYSHLRLTLSQTFNSLGTFIGPLLGAHLFLKGIEVKQGTVVTEAVRAQALAGIDSAYFWICGLIAALAAFFWLSRRVVTRAAPPPSAEARGSLGALVRDAFSSRWALLGGAAIFLYVGAEVSIGTQMALFLNSDAVWGLSDAPFSVPLLGLAMGSDGVPGVSLQEAGKAVAFYWGGAMVGRAVGSGLLAFVRASRLLTLFAAVAAAMCLYVFAVGRRDGGIRRIVHRAVQLDHVPGDLHADARTVERERGGDFGAAVHRDHRRRLRPAAGRRGVGGGRLCLRADRAGDLLCRAVPVRARGGPRRNAGGGMIDRRKLIAAVAALPFAPALADAQEAPGETLEQQCRLMLQRQDWTGLDRYAEDDRRLLASGAKTGIVFMGDSITAGWRDKRPAFFRPGRVCRGIGGQTHAADGAADAAGRGAAQAALRPYHGSAPTTSPATPAR